MSKLIITFVLILVFLTCIACTSVPPSLSAPVKSPYTTVITPSPIPAVTLVLTPSSATAKVTPPPAPAPGIDASGKATTQPPPGIAGAKVTATPTPSPEAALQTELDSLTDRTKKLEDGMTGVPAIQANMNTAVPAITKLQQDLAALNNQVLSLESQMQVSQGLWIYDRDNVELHLLKMTGTIPNLSPNDTSYTDLSFRVYNNSGKKITGLDIAGSVKSTHQLNIMNYGFPQLNDSSSTINYHPQFDNNSTITFEAYSFDINNKSSIDFRPRISLQSGYPQTQPYNFTMTITGFSFLEQ